MNLKLMLIMVIKVLSMQTLLDVSVSATGIVDNAFAIAKANSISVTDVLAPGTELIIPTTLPVVTKELVYDAPVVEKVVQVRVRSKQTFFDLAIQCTGLVSNAFAIAQANGKSVTDALASGSMVTIPIMTRSVKTLNYYQSQTIVPATGKTITRPTTLEYYFCGEFPLSF